jgi:agmatinase
MSTLGHQYDNSLVSNAFGFLRLPMNFQPYDSDADWVITGVPFDMATSGRAGGRHGPAAIRQVSTNLAWEHNRFPWNFDMRERLNVVDCGDLVYAFGDAREMSEKLQAHAESCCLPVKDLSLWRRHLRDPAAAAPRPCQTFW